MPSFGDFRESSTRLMNQAKTKMGMEIEQKPSEDSDVLEDLGEFCPKLTFQQRVIGFFSCFALGCKYCAICLLRLWKIKLFLLLTNDLKCTHSHDSPDSINLYQS